MSTKTSGSGGCGGVVRVVDVRSDTMSKPTPAMRKTILEADLGDDVFGEDPTVNALQKRVASLLGKDAALIVPTGTMANLIAVLGHCERRGCEMILGDMSHIHRYEQGGIAQLNECMESTPTIPIFYLDLIAVVPDTGHEYLVVEVVGFNNNLRQAVIQETAGCLGQHNVQLGGVHPKTLRNQPDGTFNHNELLEAVRSEDVHFPRTALVCVENTHNMAGGKVLPLHWMDELGAMCKKLNLPIHMDGARLLNAAVALKEPPSRLVRDCTSVSLCLSKGLGAPVGSLLAGPCEFIYRARRLRKVLGGGMRQAGIIAAPGLYALEHVYPRLHQDHEHIQIIAKAVAGCGSPAITCDPEGAHTNILMLNCNMAYITPQQLCQRMEEVTEEEVAVVGERVVAKMAAINLTTVRLVTHINITPDDIKALVAKMVYVIKEMDRPKST